MLLTLVSSGWATNIVTVVFTGAVSRVQVYDNTRPGLPSTTAAWAAHLHCQAAHQNLIQASLEWQR